MYTTCVILHVDIVKVILIHFLLTDNNQCSHHFTDQQYEVDPVSGDVTVEWEGTGPSETVQVSQFNCRVDNGGSFPCKILCIDRFMCSYTSIFALTACICVG